MIVTGYITYKPLVQRFHFHETIVRQGKGDVQEYEFLELPNSLKTVGEVITHVKTKLDIDMDLKFCFEQSLLRPDLSTEVFRTAKGDVVVSPYPLPAMSSFEKAVQSMSFVNEETELRISPILLQESDESKDSETTRSSMYETFDEDTISALDVSVDAEDDVSGQSSTKVLEKTSVTAQCDSTTMSKTSTPKPVKRRVSFADCLVSTPEFEIRSPKMLKMSGDEGVEMTSGSGVTDSTLSESTLEDEKCEEFNFKGVKFPTFSALQSVEDITLGSWLRFAKMAVDGTKGPLQDYRVLSEVTNDSFFAIEITGDGSLKVSESYMDHAGRFDLTGIQDVTIASDLVDEEEEDTVNEEN